MSNTMTAKQLAAALLTSSPSTCEALITLAGALSDHIAAHTDPGSDECPVQTRILDTLRTLASRNYKAEQATM